MDPAAITAAQTALTELSDMLAGMNYVVGIDLVTGPPAATPEAAALSLLTPNAEVSGVTAVYPAELLGEFERCVRWPGVPGTGPDPGVVGSEPFQERTSLAAVCLEQLAAEAEFVGRFWITGTRNYAGVMWEFAFVFHGPARSAVLTGWSSD